MNTGIPADDNPTGIGARVDVASRLAIPVQRLDSGRHTISAGLGRGDRRACCEPRRAEPYLRDVRGLRGPWRRARFAVSGRGER